VAWMGNIKMWTGLLVEESIRVTEDRDKCQVIDCLDGESTSMMWPTFGSRTAKEQNGILNVTIKLQKLTYI